MAASSIVFRPTDPTYANTLVTHARQLYSFAETVASAPTATASPTRRATTARGAASTTSWSGARSGSTGPPARPPTWPRPRAGYANLGTEPQSHDQVATSGPIAWDDKSYGALRAAGQADRQAAVPRRRQPLARLVDRRRERPAVAYSPGGQAVLDRWGSLRYARQHRLRGPVRSDCDHRRHAQGPLPRLRQAPDRLRARRQPAQLRRT